MSLPDVAAMKLSAVTNRRAKKDFYDLHMLLKTMGLKELLRVYQSKFPDTDPMMLLRSLTYFMDAEEDEDPVSLINQDWEQVKSGIVKAVKEML